MVAVDAQAASAMTQRGTGGSHRYTSDWSSTRSPSDPQANTSDTTGTSREMPMKFR